MDVDPSATAPPHGQGCQCARQYRNALKRTHLKERRLGKGTYGEVYLYHARRHPFARHAVKLIEGGFWGGKRDHYPRDVQREKELQERAALQGVAPRMDSVQTLGVDCEKGFNCFALWMQPVGHVDLWFMLTHIRTWTARGIHHLLRELVRLLEGLQKAGVAHLDLAPANIRVQIKPHPTPAQDSLEDIATLWAIDFGFSLPTQQDELTKVHFMEDGILGGQYDSMPPERLIHYARDRPGPWYAKLLEMMNTRQLPAPPTGHLHLEMTDVYSVGVILWWLLAGESAMRPCQTPESKTFLDTECTIFESMDQTEYLGCRALVERMYFENPAGPRPALRMPQLAELVYGMTSWDMSKRWTLDRIKAHPFVATEFDQLGEAWTEVYPDKAVAPR